MENCELIIHKAAKKQIAEAVGTAEETYEYLKLPKWWSDTEKKTLEPTNRIRKKAFETDDLIGSIVTHLRNILIADYELTSNDNEKYADLLQEIRHWLDSPYPEGIDLLKVFREDFADYAIIYGHAYRQKRYNKDGELEYLQKVTSDGTTWYRDSRDFRVQAYYQEVWENNNWGRKGISKKVKIWFIPGGIKNLAKFREKYNIDTQGAEIGDSEEIIHMYKDNPPIDRCILPIFLKQVIKANSPNAIYSVLYPFVQAIKGIITEGTDNEGNKTIITNIPKMPAPELAKIDAERYAAEKKAYEDFWKAMEDFANDIIKYRAEGGVITTAADTELKVIESGRTISSDFIKTLIDIFNESISNALSFPLALISAKGAELATSRTILETVFTAYRGERQEYNRIANQLIREKFGDVVKEANIKFKLKGLDTTDKKTDAEIRLRDSNALVNFKKIGASDKDIINLAKEWGYNLELGGEGLVTGMFSADMHSKKNNLEAESEKLKNELLATYMQVKAEIEELLKK